MSVLYQNGGMDPAQFWCRGYPEPSSVEATRNLQLILHCLQGNSGTFKNTGISLWNCPKLWTLENFAIAHQLSQALSTSVDAQCDKLAIVASTFVYNCVQYNWLNAAHRVCLQQRRHVHIHRRLGRVRHWHHTATIQATTSLHSAMPDG